MAQANESMFKFKTRLNWLNKMLHLTQKFNRQLC